MAGTPALSSPRVMQVNLNHCAAAQDLLIANMAQWEVDLAVVAEPYYVPHGAVVSSCGLATILVPKGSTTPLQRLAAGEGWVAAEWGKLTVVSCYISPKPKKPAFERYLGALRTFVVQCKCPRILLLGDFNAKSTAWQCPEERMRGRLLRTWAEGLELRVQNTGSEPTCVRPQGTSIVDVTFCTPEVNVTGWRVMDEETLSDHRYIIFGLGGLSSTPRPRPRQDSSPKWALRRLDRVALKAAVAAVTWNPDSTDPCADVGAEAAAFREVMTDISNACMPRAGTAPPGRRAVYWWTAEIEGLRNACLRARHQLPAPRRRQDDGGEEVSEETAATEMALREQYRTARADFSGAIAKGKYQAWTEFLGTLDSDPWGRPYRFVRKKLRPWAPPVTESLDPQFLGTVIDTLFPGSREEVDPCPQDQNGVWSEELGVSEEELGSAMTRLGLKDTAPGPDGIHGKVWCTAHKALGPRLRRLFDACLSRGEFPPQWRCARLVLLRKEGRPADQPSAYRPICLLDEVGKLFERVIVNRLVEHLSQRGPDLSEAQFGFREGRSTIDAIEHLRSLTEPVVKRGGVALAISFDIANAFNTLPWVRIREALRKHAVPPYLRRVLASYLRDRWVEYPGQDGKVGRREVFAGVPQGSVLGPTLWNIGYNTILRAVLPPCVRVVCYADDTLLVATVASWVDAHQRAEVGARLLVSRIRALGLRVDLRKTEALWFHAPRRRIPVPVTQIRLGSDLVRTGPKMKYLGLILDGTWDFRAHFDSMVPRIRGASWALGRLLPLRGGPKHGVRRLYSGVVRSMALYGAPVWARDLEASPHNRRTLLQMGRGIAQKIARTYRTTAAMTAHLLAGLPPFDLLAELYSGLYRKCKQIRQGVRKGDSAEKEEEVERARAQAWRSLSAKWQRRLVDFDHIEAVRAIRPHFDAWMGSCRRPTGYMAQMITGHGVFGDYLHRIKRESATTCRHCGAAPDSAAHTLQECPSWAEDRRVLRGALRCGALTLSRIVPAILESDEKWEAFSSFCETVMSQKEEKEKEAERLGVLGHGPRRKRRRGRLGVAPLSDPSGSDSSEDDWAPAARGAAQAGVGLSTPAGGVASRRPPRGPPTLLRGHLDPG